MAGTLESRFGLAELTVTDPPTLAEIDLRTPRLDPPPTLAEICRTDTEARAGHTYGKSFRDIVRGYARDTRNGHHSTVPNRECAPVGSSAPI